MNKKYDIVSVLISLDDFAVINNQGNSAFVRKILGKCQGILLYNSYFCMNPVYVSLQYGPYSRQSFLFIQENFSKHGVAALNLTMDYDENEIMNNNLKYLTNTLEVSLRMSL